MNKYLIEVIIHEIGHFIANELNHRLFRTGENISISIKGKLDQNGQLDFEGVIVSNVNKKSDDSTNWELLSPRIANLVYGCYFQCLFTKSLLNSCFEFGNGNLRGARDRQMFMGVFPRSFERNNREDTEAFIYSFFQELSDARDKFEPIFQIDLNQILVDTEDAKIESYTIDILKLREIISPFIESHQDRFIKFHQGIEEIKSSIT